MIAQPFTSAMCPALVLSMAYHDWARSPLRPFQALPRLSALTGPAIPGITSQNVYKCNLFLSEIDKQRLTEKHKVIELNLKAKINSNGRKLSRNDFSE